jgi:hypothetical protein
MIRETTIELARAAIAKQSELYDAIGEMERHLMVDLGREDTLDGLDSLIADLAVSPTDDAEEIRAARLAVVEDQ